VAQRAADEALAIVAKLGEFRGGGRKFRARLVANGYMGNEEPMRQ
jgi:hypothetical protein